MFALLSWLSDLLARVGVRSRSSAAERRLDDPDQAWRIACDPTLWSLWMPGVRDVLDTRGRLVPGARFPVRTRLRSGRLGLAGSGARGALSEVHVVLDAFEPQSTIAWRLVAGKREESYRLHRSGALFTLTGKGGDPAERVLAELDRETRPWK